MNVLVTGGAGYIGSHTCKALALAGHTPVVYDNLSTGHRELVRWGAFAHGDILDTARLAQTMREHAITAVIHFAALSQVGESVMHPALYYRNNVGGTQSILEAMRLAQVRDIVVSGTCAVYGIPERVPIDEECAKNPINPYGKTKLAMETMLADYAAAYGLRGVPLRYFNAAGCDPEGETGEWHSPESHLIPRVIMAARGMIPALSIFGNDYPTRDGTCIRDYIHVMDLADAHVRALGLCDRIDGMMPINLGVGQGFSVAEIVDAAQKTLGVSVPHEWHARREGDPPMLVANAAKARQMLGWTPTLSNLESIISSAAAWHDTLQAYLAHRL
jgi:UDP-glucose-4-epimerase GalE